MAERWVPTLDYALARVDGQVHVVRRGGVFVESRVPDDEVLYRSIAVAKDYDEGVRILRSLRSTLTEGNDDAG